MSDIAKSRTVAIYKDHDLTQDPIGYIEFSEELSEEEIRDCALIPMVMRGGDSQAGNIHSFGMVERTTVDARSWSELGL